MCGCVSKSGNADMDSNSQEDMDKSIFGCILTLIYDDDNYYFSSVSGPNGQGVYLMVISIFFFPYYHSEFHGNHITNRRWVAFIIAWPCQPMHVCEKK